MHLAVYDSHPRSERIWAEVRWPEVEGQGEVHSMWVRKFEHQQRVELCAGAFGAVKSQKSLGMWNVFVVVVEINILLFPSLTDVYDLDTSILRKICFSIFVDSSILQYIY